MQILFPLNHMYFAADEQGEKVPFLPVFPYKVAKILCCNSLGNLQTTVPNDGTTIYSKQKEGKKKRGEGEYHLQISVLYMNAHKQILKQRLLLEALFALQKADKYCFMFSHPEDKHSLSVFKHHFEDLLT